MSYKPTTCDKCGAIDRGRPICDICGVDDHGCHLMAFEIDCGFGSLHDGEILHACSAECLLKLAKRIYEDEEAEQNEI